jgi:hypothetical protein
MTHTPGPWVAEPEYEGDDATLVHANGVTIADCGYLPRPLAVAEANARLIAAAPDMLALLKEFYEHGYTTTGDHDRLSAVIAKATGVS